MFSKSSRFCLLLVSTFVLLSVTVTKVDGLPLDCNFEKKINIAEDHERLVRCSIQNGLERQNMLGLATKLQNPNSEPMLAASGGPSSGKN